MLVNGSEVVGEKTTRGGREGGRIRGRGGKKGKGKGEGEGGGFLRCNRG